MKLIVKIALGIILALVLLVAGCGALVAASADDIEKEMATQTFAPSAGSGADDSPNEDDPTFQNGVLTTPDLKIADHALQGHQGRPEGQRVRREAGHRLLVQDHEPVRREGRPDARLP